MEEKTKFSKNIEIRVQELTVNEKLTMIDLM